MGLYGKSYTVAELDDRELEEKVDGFKKLRHELIDYNHAKSRLDKESYTFTPDIDELFNKYNEEELLLEDYLDSVLSTYKKGKVGSYLERLDGGRFRGFSETLFNIGLTYLEVLKEFEKEFGYLFQVRWFDGHMEYVMDMEEEEVYRLDKASVPLNVKIKTYDVIL